MERRLAEIAPRNGATSRSTSPRANMYSDYLAHSFPTQLYNPLPIARVTCRQRPAFRDGQAVQCRDAVARRELLIEKLASLTPVHGALDPKSCSASAAEVTGRSRRIIRKRGADGVDRLVVENRTGSANLGETQAFMDDVKRILVFSDAGGTGRSSRNCRRRTGAAHTLSVGGRMEGRRRYPGIRRTNRPNQAQPPLFRPIATNVKAERQPLSTIARRLDTLGAITKGQRQTGGQGLFRPEAI